MRCKVRDYYLNNKTYLLIFDIKDEFYIDNSDFLLKMKFLNKQIRETEFCFPYNSICIEMFIESQSCGLVLVWLLPF